MVDHHDKEKTEGHCRRGLATAAATAADDATINYIKNRRERYFAAPSMTMAPPLIQQSTLKRIGERDATAPGERERDVPPTTQQSNL